jgi:serine/threonine-protein kinase
MGRDAASTPTPLRFALETRAALTFERGSRNAQISADGQSIVFRGAQAGRTMLFHRALDRNGATPIPGTEDAEFHAISPDSRWLAFVGLDGSVQRVPLEGGAPAEMIEVPAPPIGLDWSSPTDLEMGMLAFNDDYPGITSVSIDDRTLRVRTGPPEGNKDEWWGMHHEPYALPGGTHVLFQNFSGGAVGLGIADLRDGSYRPIDLSGALIRRSDGIVGVSGDVLLFVDTGGRLMAVRWDERALDAVGEPVPVPGTPPATVDATLSATGTLVVTQGAEQFVPVLVDDRGQVIRQLWPEGVDQFYPRMSPDGRRLAAGMDDFRGTEDVWIYDFASQALNPAGLGFWGTPGWTDGGRRVFALDDVRYEGGGNDDQYTQLWSRPIDASEDPSILQEVRPGRVFGADLSPDGRTFAIMLDNGDNPVMRRLDVVTLSLGDSIHTPFATAAQDEIAPRFSPDGRWLAFMSMESGRPQVYIRQFPGPGPRLQVSQESAGQPVWDPAGDRIYFMGAEGLYAADLAGGETGELRVTRRQRLFDPPVFGSPTSWTATYDVHPEGFVMALDERGTAGRMIVWTDWMHEVRELLAQGR